MEGDTLVDKNLISAVCTSFNTKQGQVLKHRLQAIAQQRLNGLDKSGRNDFQKNPTIKKQETTAHGMMNGAAPPFMPAWPTLNPLDVYQQGVVGVKPSAPSSLPQMTHPAFPPVTPDPRLPPHWYNGLTVPQGMECFVAHTLLDASRTARSDASSIPTVYPGYLPPHQFSAPASRSSSVHEHYSQFKQDSLSLGVTRSDQLLSPGFPTSVSEHPKKSGLQHVNKLPAYSELYHSKNGYISSSEGKGGWPKFDLSHDTFTKNLFCQSKFTDSYSKFKNGHPSSSAADTTSYPAMPAGYPYSNPTSVPSLPVKSSAADMISIFSQPREGDFEQFKDPNLRTINLAPNENASRVAAEIIQEAQTLMLKSPPNMRMPERNLTSPFYNISNTYPDDSGRQLISPFQPVDSIHSAQMKLHHLYRPASNQSAHSLELRSPVEFRAENLIHTTPYKPPSAKAAEEDFWSQYGLPPPKASSNWPSEKSYVKQTGDFLSHSDGLIKMRKTPNTEQNQSHGLEPTVGIQRHPEMQMKDMMEKNRVEKSKRRNTSVVDPTINDLVDAKVQQIMAACRQKELERTGQVSQPICDPSHSRSSFNINSQSNLLIQPESNFGEQADSKFPAINSFNMKSSQLLSQQDKTVRNTTMKPKGTDEWTESLNQGQSNRKTVEEGKKQYENWSGDLEPMHSNLHLPKDLSQQVLDMRHSKKEKNYQTIPSHSTEHPALLKHFPEVSDPKKINWSESEKKSHSLSLNEQINQMRKHRKEFHISDEHAGYSSHSSDKYTEYPAEISDRHSSYLGDKSTGHPAHMSNEHTRHPAHMSDKHTRHLAHMSDKHTGHPVHMSDKHTGHSSHMSDQHTRHPAHMSDKHTGHPAHMSDKLTGHSSHMSDQHARHPAHMSDQHTGHPAHMSDKLTRHSSRMSDQHARHLSLMSDNHTGHLAHLSNKHSEHPFHMSDKHTGHPSHMSDKHTGHLSQMSDKHTGPPSLINDKHTGNPLHMSDKHTGPPSLMSDNHTGHLAHLNSKRIGHPSHMSDKLIEQSGQSSQLSDTHNGHPSNMNDKNIGHPLNMNDKYTGHTFLMSDMHTGHPSYMNDKHTGHPSYMNDKHTGHPSNTNDKHTGHPSNRNDQHTGHPSNMSDKHTGHPSNRNDQHTGHPSNMSDKHTGHPSNMSDKHTGHPSNMNDKHTGHPSNMNDKHTGHSSNMNDKHTGHPSNMSDKHTGHPSNMSDQHAGHPSNMSDQHAGHPSNMNDQHTGHPSNMNDKHTGHPSNMNDKQTGHPSNMNDKHTGHPSNMSDQHAGQPSHMNDKHTGYLGSRVGIFACCNKCDQFGVQFSEYCQNHKKLDHHEDINTSNVTEETKHLEDSYRFAKVDNMQKTYKFSENKKEPGTFDKKENVPEALKLSGKEEHVLDPYRFEDHEAQLCDVLKYREAKTKNKLADNDDKFHDPYKVQPSKPSNVHDLYPVDTEKILQDSYTFHPPNTDRKHDPFKFHEPSPSQKVSLGLNLSKKVGNKSFRIKQIKSSLSYLKKGNKFLSGKYSSIKKINPNRKQKVQKDDFAEKLMKNLGFLPLTPQDLIGKRNLKLPQKYINGHSTIASSVLSTENKSEVRNEVPDGIPSPPTVLSSQNSEALKSNLESKLHDRQDQQNAKPFKLDSESNKFHSKFNFLPRSKSAESPRTRLGDKESSFSRPRSFSVDEKNRTYSCSMNSVIGSENSGIRVNDMPTVTDAHAMTLTNQINDLQKMITGQKNCLETNTVIEVPSCECLGPNGVFSEAVEGPYYTHLGAGRSLEAIRKTLEDRMSVTGKSIRIEKVRYTGREGKSSRGCPIAKWIVRRSNAEEKYLAIVRHRPGHFCETAWLIIGLVAWEGVPATQADDLYDFLCHTLPEKGNETERRCGTNDRKMCACQGADLKKRGASFSFGCSWSMYFNGCKFARSHVARKFRLKDSSKETDLENRLQELASMVAPVYKQCAPDAYANQTSFSKTAQDCRLGKEADGPFSGVTSCIDFCAHAHKDIHNMNNGSTVVVTLTKHRGLSKPEDEQLHVLPMYVLEPTDEKGSYEGQYDKIQNGELEVLHHFPLEARIRGHPLTPCKKRRAMAKKSPGRKRVWSPVLGEKSHFSWGSSSSAQSTPRKMKGDLSFLQSQDSNQSVQSYQGSVSETPVKQDTQKQNGCKIDGDKPISYEDLMALSSQSGFKGLYEKFWEYFYSNGVFPPYSLLRGGSKLNTAQSECDRNKTQEKPLPSSIHQSHSARSGQQHTIIHKQLAHPQHKRNISVDTRRPQTVDTHRLQTVDTHRPQTVDTHRPPSVPLDQTRAANNHSEQTRLPQSINSIHVQNPFSDPSVTEKQYSVVSDENNAMDLSNPKMSEGKAQIYRHSNVPLPNFPQNRATSYSSHGGVLSEQQKLELNKNQTLKFNSGSFNSPLDLLSQAVEMRTKDIGYNGAMPNPIYSSGNRQDMDTTRDSRTESMNGKIGLNSQGQPSTHFQGHVSANGQSIPVASKPSPINVASNPGHQSRNLTYNGVSAHYKSTSNTEQQRRGIESHPSEYGATQQSRTFENGFAEFNTKSPQSGSECRPSTHNHEVICGQSHQSINTQSGVNIGIQNDTNQIGQSHQSSSFQGHQRTIHGQLGANSESYQKGSQNQGFMSQQHEHDLAKANTTLTRSEGQDISFRSHDQAKVNPGQSTWNMYDNIYPQCSTSQFSADFMNNGQFPMTKPTEPSQPDPDVVKCEMEYNEEAFRDPNIGGVAIALSHGAVLFEVAKRELHATTGLRNPNRYHPTRISLVFYQHKNLNTEKHGMYVYAKKLDDMKQKRIEKMQEERGFVNMAEIENSFKGGKKRKLGDDDTTGEAVVDIMKTSAAEYRYMWDCNARRENSIMTDTVSTKWINPQPVVTGPYQKWV